MYLDDTLCYHNGPHEHFANIATFLLRLEERNLKLSPKKTRIGATEADFLGYRNHA